jgi:hypothetical protein
MSQVFSHNNRPPPEPRDLSHIRLAGEPDEMQIFNLCSLMHAEAGFHPLSWPKVAAMVRLATQRTRGIIGVIGEPYDLKAAIFMVIEPIWYSDDWHLLEYFNYVRPDARKSRYAQDLIAYGKKCADEIGVDFMCGVFSNRRTEAKCRLYQRMLPKMGEFYNYRPEKQTMELVRLQQTPPANTVAAE